MFPIFGADHWRPAAGQLPRSPAAPAGGRFRQRQRGVGRRGAVLGAGGLRAARPAAAVAARWTAGGGHEAMEVGVAAAKEVI